MERKYRKKTGALFCLFLSALLLLTAFPEGIPANAAEVDPSAEYIVKYAEEAASLTEDKAEEPVDVVDGKE